MASKPMTTPKDDQRRCPTCEKLIFPVLDSRPDLPDNECGHMAAFWVWVCYCGYHERRPFKRCPFCVGARPAMEETK